VRRNINAASRYHKFVTSSNIGRTAQGIGKSHTFG
jgi:hypothetical protein